MARPWHNSKIEFLSPVGYEKAILVFLGVNTLTLLKIKDDFGILEYYTLAPESHSQNT